MYLPRLNQLRSDVSAITQFGGYNHNLRISDAEFADMSCMTSEDSPVIGTRNRRGIVSSLTKCNGIIAHDHLAWVDGTAFFYNGEEITGLTLTDTRKQMVIMGAYIVIFPDKKYYNTSDGTYGSMGANVVITCSAGAPLEAALTDLYGQEFIYTTGNTAPELPNDHDYWMDTSVVPNVLKVYIAAQYSWISVPTTYIKIEAAGIGSAFEKFDAVTITGSLNGVLDSSYTIYDKGDDYIIVMGLIDSAVSQTSGSVSISRPIPDMDYICEMDNRLWGCSSANHEIYASKLGDFKNFNSYQGLSTDSYTVTVGTKGDFTGCISHLGYVYFFKENVIHKIYGNKPSNFQMNNINARGVKKGSSKSLVIVNETLYYHSLSGVVALTTSLPEDISMQLNDTFSEAMAGACGNYYIISMRNSSGQFITFAYDTERNIWLKDGEYQITYLQKLGEDMFYADSNGNLCSWKRYGENKFNSIYRISADETNQFVVFGQVEPAHTAQKICLLPGTYTFNVSSGAPVQIGYTLPTDGPTEGHLFTTTPSTEIHHTFTVNETTHYAMWAMRPVADGGISYSDIHSFSLIQVIDQEPVLVYDLETGDLGLDDPYQKYIKKLFIRCELEGAVSISMRFDNNPVWQHMMTIRTEYLRSYNIPIAVRRCDHLRVRFEGSGVFRLFSFARETETGSEIS